MIPFILILIVLLFLCCIGRLLQVRTNRFCNFVICPCFRPKDKNIDQMHDAVICFDELDELWVEKLVSNINEKRNLKISLFHVSDEKSSKYNFSKLQNSLRIIVIVSTNFFEKKMLHTQFLSYLRILLEKNKNLVIIVINKGTEKKKFNKILKYLKFSDNHSKQTLRKITSKIRYNLGIEQVEKLNYYDKNFWWDFFYLLPFTTIDKANYDHEFNQSLPKIKTRQLNNQKSNDFNMSYASDFKDKTRLKNVIIPIPDFMRTSLGFSRQKHYDSIQKKKKLSSFKSLSEQFDQKIDIIGEQHQKKNLQSSKFLKNEEKKSAIQNNLDAIKMNENLREKKLKRETSESADILAMFAPDQNMIYPLKKDSNKK